MTNDMINYRVREKYFGENNGVKQLLKVADQISRCFNIRVKNNENNDKQLENIKKPNTIFSIDYYLYRIWKVYRNGELIIV